MEFSLEKSIEILEKTPAILESYLKDLSKEWLKNNEGENTWSPYEVLGHLIFGEKTDWMVRIKVILSDSENKLFEPYNRFAHLNDDPNKSISELLKEFRELRKINLKELKSFNIIEKDFNRIGIHPEFGEVTLAQLVSAWVVHDLGHIGQIARVMAKQYKNEVGPWKAYLGVLK